MPTITANRAQQQATEFVPAVGGPRRAGGWRSSREGNRVVRWIVESLIAIASLLFLIPVVLIFLTSLKPENEILHFESLLPRQPIVGAKANFGHLYQNSEESPIGTWLFNSVFISSCVTLLVLTVDSLAAYALARMRLPGGKVVLSIIIATLMVPGQILLVPVYLILNRLGWLDTPLALIVPAGAGAFGVFLLHQFFKSIPRELEEAAALDGAGPLRTFWHVMLPLSRPALATLGILVFIGSWNDFLGPLVFLDSLDRYTLPVGVALFQSSYSSEYGLTLAASVICTAPILLIFLIFSRQIIRGISTAGLKE